MPPTPLLFPALALSALALLWAPSTQLKQACPAAEPPPTALPEQAAALMRRAFEDARGHEKHLWRDTAAVHADGTVTVVVEIASGSSEKREFDMRTNRLTLDRRVPGSLGGYPTGYGFIPQTIGIDGDPFDGLVVGGPAPAGKLVRGHVLGIMHMTDEKGHDAKIVIAAEADRARRRGLLNAAEQRRIAAFFNRYKAEDDDEESWACVSGWGDVAEARRYLDAAHRLFTEGRRGTTADSRPAADSRGRLAR